MTNPPMLPLLALLALGAPWLLAQAAQARRGEAPGIVLAQARPGGPAPAATPDAGLVRQWERRVGDWTVARYQDAGARRLVRCELERSFPDGRILRIGAMTGMGLRIGFASGNDALDRLGASFAIRYWVDDEAMARTATATIGPPGFARFSEADGEPGSEDGLANGRVFFIRAGNTLLRFPLDRSNAAFRQLFGCSGS